jgi:transposase
VVDSQSVKTSGVGGEDRGYDGGKKIKGRKRHLLVDTEGFVLKVKVHSAKVMDHEGIKALLRKADERFSRLSHLWLDAGYRGEDKGKDWVEKTLGWSAELVERPKKPAPERVLMAWAREWATEGVKADWKKLMPPEGFLIFAEALGSRTDVFLDRPTKEDEQGLREALCERGSVRVRCDDSPHDEAPCPHLRPFHTVSE